MSNIKGYKVFNSDWTCRGFQYKVGETFVHNGNIEMCGAGFHFCQKASDCFNYCKFDYHNKVAEVEAIGLVETRGDKSVTDKIIIVREITWLELLTIVNTGNNNTGYRNTGDYNTGNRNTGDWNTGDNNTGDNNTGNNNTGNRNTGDYNTGNRNIGNSNTGYRNAGDWNTGDSNTGDSNTGDYNTGYRNTGDYNTGDWNIGNYNTGDYNTGNYNAGDCNTGSLNAGDYNTGNYNTGDCNTGEWNSTNFSSGFFNSIELPIYIFNQPINVPRNDFDCAGLRVLRWNFENSWWIYENNMTEEEKIKYPTYKTTGGYLKTVDFKTACRMMWNNLDDDDKKEVKKIPNFNAEIFEEITGINVNNS